MVSLWPVMMNLVSALYPDAADVAHVHIGWAAMFALTSCGIAGYSMGTARSYYNAPDGGTEIALCEGSTKASLSLPKPAKASVSRNLHVVSLCLLLFAVTIYATFAGLFLVILKKTILAWLCEPYCFGALWYFVCSVLALLQTVKYVLSTDNTTLYVSGKRTIPKFEKWAGVNTGMWLRVLKFHFSNKPYRLLVKKPEESLASGLFDTLIVTLRLAVFVFGSVTQCSLIVMPTPLDGLLFGLIVATAFLSRVLWMKICSKAVHHDTCIVFYEVSKRPSCLRLCRSQIPRRPTH